VHIDAGKRTGFENFLWDRRNRWSHLLGIQRSFERAEACRLLREKSHEFSPLENPQKEILVKTQR
jgi:hypothetical protein